MGYIKIMFTPYEAVRNSTLHLTRHVFIKTKFVLYVPKCKLCSPLLRIMEKLLLYRGALS